MGTGILVKANAHADIKTLKQSRHERNRETKVNSSQTMTADLLI